MGGEKAEKRVEEKIVEEKSREEPTDGAFGHTRPHFAVTDCQDGDRGGSGAFFCLCRLLGTRRGQSSRAG
jgi:hypothetical protein